MELAGKIWEHLLPDALALFAVRHKRQSQGSDARRLRFDLADPHFHTVFVRKKYEAVATAALLLTGPGKLLAGRWLFVEIHQLRLPVLGYLVNLLRWRPWRWESPFSDWFR
jgi:hypothetical protein